MDNLNPAAIAWLEKTLGEQFRVEKHTYSHQDEVYKIEAQTGVYYLKASATLEAERANLIKLKPLLNVPAVVGSCRLDDADYLLLTALPGRNLAELIGEWSDTDIVRKFAEAVRELHAIDVNKLFPQTALRQVNPGDVLLHGDMALPNIIISDDTSVQTLDKGRVGQIGYIDFGQLSFGAPDADLADAIWSLQRNISPTKANYGELFLEQYGPFTRTAKLAKALAFRYHP